MKAVVRVLSFVLSIVAVAILLPASVRADHSGGTPHMNLNLSAPATNTSGSYTVTWSWSSSITYILEEKLNGGSYFAVYSGTSGSKSFSGKQSGTFTYRVRRDICFWGSCESMYTAPVSTVVTRTPGTPTLSGPSTDTDGTFTISWSAITYATRYEVQERLNSGSWAQIYNSSSTSVGRSSLSPGTYSYRIRACGSSSAGSCSAWSSTYHQVVVPVPIPATPSGISGPSTATGSFVLSWSSVSGATTYRLQELVPGGSWAIIQNSSTASRTINPPADGTYQYRVSACNSSGCSSYSSPAKTVQVTLPPPVPATPSGISGPSTSTGSYALSWSTVTHATYYKLQELVPGGSWQTDNVSGTSRGFTKTTDGNYQYRLAACNSSGCSGYSATVKSVQVSIPPPFPATPGALSGPSAASGSFTLSWAAVAHATFYKFRERVPGGVWQTVNVSTTGRSVSPTATGTHQYRIQACNSTGCSDWSAIKIVIVSSPPDSIPAPPAPTTHADPGALTSSDSVGTTAGEFRVDESGAATYSIPILTAEGTAGVAPRISLNYSSGSGIGIAGMGWSIGGLSAITRCKQTYDQDRTVLPISWSSTDRYCLDGQRLLLEDSQQTYGAANTVYRTEIDTGVRVFIRGNNNGEPDYFEALRKDGSTSFYGVSPADTGNVSAKYGGAAGETFVWAIREYRDNIGNPIWFDYHNDANGHRINTIYWAYGTGRIPADGYGARLLFEYENRDDHKVGYVAGIELVSKQRLSAIKSYNTVGSEALIREYKLSYGAAVSTNDQVSRLIGIEECVGAVCLPQTVFDWRLPVAAPTMTQLSSFTMAESSDLSDFTLADVNGDGLMDLVWIEGAAANGILNYAISDGTNYTQAIFNGGGLEYSLPGGGEKLTAVDYNMDGRQDIAYWVESVSRWRIIVSVPQTDGSWRLKTTTITTPIDNDEVSFVDVDSNGTTDAVWTAGSGVGSGQLYLSRLEKNPNEQPSSSNFYRFGTPEPIGVPSAATTGKIRAIAADFNGDGSVGIVMGYDQPICEFAETPPLCVDPKYAQLLNIDAVNAASPSYAGYADLNNVGPTASNEHVRTSGVTTADVNRDGLSDLLYPVFEDPGTDIGYYHFAINQGDGTFDVAEFYEPTLDHTNISRPQFVDWNSDGHPDLMWKSTAGAGTVYVRYWDPKLNHLSSRQVATTANDQTTESVYFPDVNGDGVADKMEIDVSTGAGTVTVYTRKSGATIVDRAVNRIEKITNGIGAETAITYEPLSYSSHYERMQVSTSPGSGTVFCIPTDLIEPICVNQPVAAQNTGDFYTAINGDWDIPGSPPSLKKTSPVLEVSGPLYVVTDVVGSAPAGTPANPGVVTTTATSSISYYYYQAKAQAAGRGLLGFQQLKTVDNIDNVETTTQYRQDWPFTGLPIGTVIASSAGRVIGGGNTEWEVLEWTQAERDAVVTAGTASLGPIYVEQTSKRENVYDLVNNGIGEGSLLSSTTTTIVYDAEANAETITVTTEDEAAAQIAQTVKTTNTYADAGTPFTLWDGRLSKSVVVTNRPAVTGSVTRTTDFNYYETGSFFGMLRQEIIEPNDSFFTLTTTHYYDTHGNRNRSTVSDGTTTRCSAPAATHVFDSSGRYVDQTYDCLGRLTSVVESRNTFGQPLSVASVLDATDTNVRFRTYMYYGALGREYFRWSSDGSARTTYFTNSAGNCPAGSAYAVTETGADGVEARMCYDVLAREVRSLSRGFDGAWDAQDTIYDSKGRVIHKSEPYDTGSSPAYWTSIQYDLRDRPTKTTRPDGSWVDVSYSGFVKTSVSSFETQTRTEEYTLLGDLKQAIDDIGGISSFTYDNLGNLATSTDASGNVTTTDFDKLSRRISMRTPHSDPTKGLWQYEYTKFGELEKQTSANGHTSEMSYDGLGRIKTRVDKFSGGTTDANTTWIYDTSPNGLGQLDTVNDAQAGYAKAILYDTLGRPDETVINFDGGAYYEKTTYDQYGRVFQYFDASGDGTFTDNGIETRYAAYGHVSAVVDAGYASGATRMVYRQVLSMNARGQVVTERLGVKPAGGYAIERTYAYYADTGRMRDIESKDDAGAWVQDLYYDWNVVGNLTTRQDTYHGQGGPNTLIENFGYDDLNRLTSHGATGQTSLSVTYDAIGNIQTKTGITGTYSYGANASPYALTGLNGAVYAYDYNGNNTSGGGRTISYSTFDKPLNISKGSNTSAFAYDVDRARYRRTDTVAGQVTTTRYVGNVEIIDRPDGTRERKRYIAGVAIETRTYDSVGGETDRETLYTLKDHLGSMDVIVDADGGIEQKLSFGPWGQRRDATNWQEVDGSNLLIDNMTGFDTSRTTRGFTGHEMIDPVGIVHMNGRIYDPMLGRFLQADNYVQAPANSQSHNRYSYVWNNPLNATDPSGEFVFTLAGIAVITSFEVTKAFTIFAIMSVAGTMDALVFTDASLGEALLSGIVSGVSAAALGGDDIGISAFRADFTGVMSSEPPKVRILSQNINGGLADTLQAGQNGHGFASDLNAGCGICPIEGNALKGVIPYMFDSWSMGLWDHTTVDWLRKDVATDVHIEAFEEALGWPGQVLSSVTGIRKETVQGGIGILKSGIKRVPEGTADIVSHPSQRAARRAAERQAGMGRHGGREQLPDQPLRPGSRSPQGDPGVRTETRSTDTGRTVHHDPYGHRDGSIPPHYGVDGPDGTTHHTYPTSHDPRTNR